MNPEIEKLYQISQKDSRLIVGLMSGTSMDGLDIALCKFIGAGEATKVALVAFETLPFDDDIKSEIRKVFAKDTVDFPHLCQLNPWIGNLHGQLVNKCLVKWGITASDVDAIASHGQTVMHQPKRLHQNKKFPNSTLQIGDADHLSMKTGILTISDFRQKHCAIGGEGAPLALYGDYLLFSSPKENRILINIGGIANFTFLSYNKDFAAAFATDTGPGNTIIDAYVLKHFGLPFDENANLAKSGKLIPELLSELKNHTYFEQVPPKTTGPELFNLAYLNSALAKLDISPTHEDTLTTLCHFSTETLCDEISKSATLNSNTSIYLSGGGMHNPLLVALIQKALPGLKIKSMDDLGISGDAKEAVLFAALANETLAGKNGFIRPDGALERFYMGKISLPK
jgi:anhydro-N-acetylmuramic acid kinase